MSVPVKNFFFHRTLHNELLADFGFMSLSAEATGVYFRLRIMAARTNNNGSISIGADRMTVDTLTAYIMQQFRKSRRDAGKIIDELKASQHLKVMGSGRVILPKYVSEQENPPSPAAERQRRSRENRRGDVTEVGDSFSHEIPSSELRPPAPPSTPDNDFDTTTTGENDTRDMSQRPVTCHGDVTHSIESKVIDRNISRSRLSSPTRTTTTTTGGAGGRSSFARPCSADALRELDLFNTDPIEAVMTMSGERDARSVNGFRKLLRLVGGPVFVEALAEVKDAMFAGKAQKPGRLVHVVATRIYQEQHNGQG